MMTFDEIIMHIWDRDPSHLKWVHLPPKHMETLSTYLQLLGCTMDTTGDILSSVAGYTLISNFMYEHGDKYAVNMSNIIAFLNTINHSPKGE